MDFEKKPGSRDAKPYKGRRKKAVNVGEKNDAIRVYAPDDAETFHLSTSYSRTSKPNSGEKDEHGMLPGVTYSLNKQGRWKIVEELKKKDDQEVLVAEFDHLTSSSSAQNQLKNSVKARKKKEAEEEKSNVDNDVGKSKKSLSKKAQRKKQQQEQDADAREAATELQRVYIVENSLTEKQIRGKKQLVCDQGRGTGCGCSSCNWRAEEDPARVNAKVQSQRELGLK